MAKNLLKRMGKISKSESSVIHCLDGRWSQCWLIKGCEPLGVSLTHCIPLPLQKPSSPRDSNAAQIQPRPVLSGICSLRCQGGDWGELYSKQGDVTMEDAGGMQAESK